MGGNVGKERTLFFFFLVLHIAAYRSPLKNGSARPIAAF